jgi:hypothetical protein
MYRIFQTVIYVVTFLRLLSQLASQTPTKFGQLTAPGSYPASGPRQVSGLFSKTLTSQL